MLVSMVLAIYPAAAQENITQLNYESGLNSMIRLIGGDSWMVCSENGVQYEFVKITTSDTADVMLLDPQLGKVSDFVIFEGTVYFCGMSAEGIPYFGYFSHTAFPSTNVAFDYLDGASSVRNIVVYKDANGARHVVLTGQDHEGYGILIEAVKMFVGWQVFYTRVFENEEEVYIFDDIAISDSYVAFTAVENCDYIRDTTDALPAGCNGRVWFLDIPAYNNLITSIKYYIDVPYVTDLPFIIKRAEKDAFITATHPITTIVSGFVGTSHHATVEAVTYPLMDISYSPDSKTTELLTYHSSTSILPIPTSYVHTLLPGMGSSSGTAYGKAFLTYKLSSVAYQQNNPNHYICSGYSVETSLNHLRLPRYHFNFSQGCSASSTIDIKPYEWKSVLLKGSSITESEYLGDPSKETTPREAQKQIICSTQKQQEN